MTLTKRLVILTAVIVTALTPLTGAAQTNYEHSDVTVGIGDISLYQASKETTPYAQPRARYVENVIFCIGDGMASAQIALARIHAAGIDGRLYMERMPVTGLVYTHSSDNAVTDSAAAGTALACGVKTSNGMIGMQPDRTKYMSILEAVRQKVFRTGLVATSTITHATPAAFASHIRSRSMEAEIAAQLLANRIDVLFGGGKKYWLPKSVHSGARKDQKNLIQQAACAGYTVIDNRADLLSVTDGPVLGLFQPDALTTVPPEPTLAEMTHIAIKILSKKSPEWFAPAPRFFLMIEGSQIDWACHANNTADCIKQTLLFDQAVKAAIDFAIKDKRTLVIVTADHETGGLTVCGDKDKPAGVRAQWATTSHTAVPVPIYAFGPGAEIFGGVYDNTEIPRKIARLLYIKDFPRPLKETCRKEQKAAAAVK